jgi:effector-binding domain-containing protein
MIISEVVPFTKIKDFFIQAYAKIGKAMAANKIKMNSAPLGLYFSYDEQKQITDMAAAIQVSKKVETGEIKMFGLPAGKSYVIDYYGPYDQVAPAYKAMELYMQANGLKQKSPVIEEYITDPGNEPDSSKWLTRIYFFAQ